MGTKVAGYCSSHAISYEIITGSSALALTQGLKARVAKNRTEIDGVIAVGGDGLAHLIFLLLLSPQERAMIWFEL